MEEPSKYLSPDSTGEDSKNGTNSLEESKVSSDGSNKATKSVVNSMVMNVEEISDKQKLEELKVIPELSSPVEAPFELEESHKSNSNPTIVLSEQNSDFGEGPLQNSLELSDIDGR